MLHSTPCASNKGNLTGRVSGSLFLPSYESLHLVVFGLNTTSKANFVKRASMYRPLLHDLLLGRYPNFLVCQ